MYWRSNRKSGSPSRKIESPPYFYFRFASRRFVADSATPITPSVAISRSQRSASAVYAIVLCPSVRPSVRHKPVIYRNDRTNRTVASLHPSHTVLWGNLGISKNERTSLWNFVPNSGLSPRQVDRVVNKTRRRRCGVVCYYFLNLGRSSRGGRQKLILEIIALMINHPSGSHQQSCHASG